ncbi:MMPL family transporter [Morganella morganii]
MTDRFPVTPGKIWVTCCLLLTILLIWLLPQSRIAYGVMSLLPAGVISDTSPALSEGFLSRLDKQLVWLISPPGNTQAQRDNAAAAWLDLVKKQAFIADVNGPVTAGQQQAWGEFYYRHRNAMADEQTRSRLLNGTQQADWIIAQLFSAFSGVSASELQHDPMLLVRGSQLALQQAGSKFMLQNGWLTVAGPDGRTWYMFHGELNDNAGDLKQIHNTAASLRTLQQQWLTQYPGGEIKVRGSLYYSDYAAAQAQSDMSRLGTVTVLGVFLLIIFVFRSVRPLFLCLFSVLTGALCGVVATLLVYGEIHLLTLVMSMSIIGISVDYAIYYLTERMVYGTQNTPEESIRKVRTALLLALGTTVAAYLIMMLAPFPGIRQLALFAAAGLTGACLTVITLFPVLVRGLPVRPVPFRLLLLRWTGLWRHHNGIRYSLPLLALLLSVTGISQLRINDDISALQSLPEHLARQDKEIGEMTGQRSDQTWFLITGSSPEEALQRLEGMQPALDVLQKKGAFTASQRLPFYSQQRQTENAALIRDAAPGVIARLEAAGAESPFIDTTPMNVTVQEWLSSPVSQGWRLMLFTLPDSGETGLLLPVTGVRDSAALAQLAEETSGVSWIARKAQFDELFGFYRLVLSILLAVAFTVIVTTYCLREGLSRGLICVIPTALSLLVSLGALGISGMPLNLFSLLALVLVLGIGINYSIFFSNPKGTVLTSLLAVTVALCTTLLTLGMLVMSSTQAIQGFGMALCSGIFSAWLFSPLTIPPAGRRHKNRNK